MPQDYLGKECALGGLTIAEFQEVFCARCLQKDCGRSNSGGSKFEQRVASWEKRLFEQIPKMGSDDSRLVTIQAQKFITLNRGPAPEVRGEWLDPRALTEPTIVKPALVPPAIVKPIVKPEVDETVVSAQEMNSVQEIPDAAPTEPDLVPDPADTEPATADFPAAPPPPPAQQRGLMNTPAKQSQMLEGAKTVKPIRDPWEPPKKTEGESGPVVEPGARIRFGQ